MVKYMQPSLKDEPFRLFVCNYQYAGREWGLELMVQGFSDTEACLAAIQGGKVDRELMARIPATVGPCGTGWFVRLMTGMAEYPAQRDTAIARRGERCSAFRSQRNLTSLPLPIRSCPPIRSVETCSVGSPAEYKSLVQGLGSLPGPR